MKKLTLYCLMILLCCCSACRQKTTEENTFKVSDIHNPQTADGMSDKANKNMPAITFETTTYDFGDVVQGEKLTYAFKFKNTGKSNLIIYSSEATCGCTTSTPPKAPIRPGESGEITVTFDSQSQNGKVTKRILVAANTYPSENILTITANVSKLK